MCRAALWELPTGFFTPHQPTVIHLPPPEVGRGLDFKETARFPLTVSFRSLWRRRIRGKKSMSFGITPRTQASQAQALDEPEDGSESKAHESLVASGRCTVRPGRWTVMSPGSRPSGLRVPLAASPSVSNTAPARISVRLRGFMLYTVRMPHRQTVMLHDGRYGSGRRSVSV